MTENKTEKNLPIAGIKPDDNKEYITTNIGFERGSDDRYEIYWLIPTNDEEAEERYNCTITDMVASGVRQLATRPDYKEIGFDAGGNLKDNGHEAMQELADGYKVGARQTGTGVKTKAKKLDTMIAEYGGGSQEELEAKLAKMKELEAKGLL